MKTTIVIAALAGGAFAAHEADLTHGMISGPPDEISIELREFPALDHGNDSQISTEQIRMPRAEQHVSTMSSVSIADDWSG